MSETDSFCVKFILKPFIEGGSERSQKFWLKSYLPSSTWLTYLSLNIAHNNNNGKLCQQI